MLTKFVHVSKAFKLAFRENIMSLNRREFIQSSSALAALYALCITRAEAQAIDTLKVVTGFPPGGTSDTTCRRLAEKLRGTYAKNTLVDNRTGAGGQIVIQTMKTTAPDGTTLMQTPMSMLGIYPHIYKKLPYDPINDVMPVSLAAVFDFGFAVGPMVPASVTNMNEFFAWCKVNPTQANFGSPAAGSVPHFIGALLGRESGIDLKHAPYRGSQPALLEMIGGNLTAVSAPVGDIMQHVAGGKARLLSTSGARRNKFAPNIATLTEQGFKDMAFSEWFGLYTAAKTPADVVQKLNAACKEAIASKEFVDGLAVFGLEAKSSSPSELAAMLKADTERWAPLVKAIGFSAEA
jgi:tripartite-type tricarboxylate transporter receptor subunit TctC